MDRQAAWRTLGTILIVAGGIVIAFAYLTRPTSAASCNYANQVQAGSCSSTPNVGYFIAAGAFALAGILVLVNAGRAR